jgi:thiol-disulfide isomerase/thioredoxin
MMLVLLAGCSHEAEPKAETPAAAAEKLKIDLASWDQVQQRISGHQGKIVVVDVWSTYCQPCLRELPGLVKLQQKHPDRVVGMTLNSNYTGDKSEPPESFRQAVADQMAAIGAEKLTHLISTEPDVDGLYPKLGVASVPVVFVYGPDGKLAKRFDNEKEEYGVEGFTYDKHIVPFVERLLGANPP